MNIRLLNANEVECRVKSLSAKGAILLLYKDARCDQKILDETFGSMNWQRNHQLIGNRLYCTVSIWDQEKQQWISKQDVGTESNNEKEKGQASYSFKRACFNIGIGRELYSSPFIWINASDIKIDIEKDKDKGKDKLTTKDKFKVHSIKYNADREISELEIINNRTNKVVYSFGKTIQEKVYKCCDCGTEFKSFTSNGRTYTAEQAYHMAQKISDDGKSRCKACRLKREDDQNK